MKYSPFKMTLTIMYFCTKFIESFIKDFLRRPSIHDKRELFYPMGSYCCIIGQQTNWIRVVMVSLVLNETNTDVRMYT